MVAVALECVLSAKSDARLANVCRLLAQRGGYLEGSNALAHAAGYRSRFELNELLKRRHLPPLERLAAWARFLSLLAAAERHGLTLETYAWSLGKEPSTFHRLCRELAHEHWKDLRNAGLAHAILVMRADCARTRPSRTVKRKDSPNEVGLEEVG